MSKKFRFLAVLTALLAGFVVFGCGDGADRDRSASTSVSDQGASLDELALLPQPLARAAAIAGLLEGADDSRVPEVKRALNRSSTTRLDGVSAAIAYQYWAKYEPKAALAWAKRDLNGAYRDQMIRDAMEIWAQSNPRDALENGWAGAGGELGTTLLQGLVAGWLFSGEGGLDDFVSELGVSVDRQMALGMIARHRMRTDGPEAVMKWANGLSGEPPFRAAAVRSVGSVLGAQRPDLAVEWCDTHCAGNYGNSLRQYIAAEWAKHDGASMMEWLREAPDEVETEVAVRAGYRAWVIADPEAAYEWVATLPEASRNDPRIEPAIGMYIARISWRDSAKAIEWTDYLSDPADQKLARITAVRRWIHRDPETAEAWLTTQTLLGEDSVEKARRIPERWNTPSVQLDIQ